MDAEFVEDVLGVGQHVHEVGNRSPLVAADVAHPRLQQRLGHRQDAFAVEGAVGPQAQKFDFLFE